MPEIDPVDDPADRRPARPIERFAVATLRDGGWWFVSRNDPRWTDDIGGALVWCTDFDAGRWLEKYGVQRDRVFGVPLARVRVVALRTFVKVVDDEVQS